MQQRGGLGRGRVFELRQEGQPLGITVNATDPENDPLVYWADNLPAGAVFPFDFGFVPGTLGEDGDPLDVLVLMDEPAFTGCLVPSRLVGVIEADEKQEGETKRNDRLIAVAAASQDHADLQTLKDVSPQLLREIEYFFASYNHIQGKEWQPLGVYGPKRAQALIEQAKATVANEKATPEERASVEKMLKDAQTLKGDALQLKDIFEAGVEIANAQTEVQNKAAPTPQHGSGAVNPNNGPSCPANPRNS